MEHKLTLKDLITKSIGSATQEMMLTLPDRLLMAFHKELHKEYINPKNGKAFESFYDWLLAIPPPGCGLSGSEYLDVEDIIRLLNKSRDKQPTEKQKKYVNDLVEELVEGFGKKKPSGGDRRSDNFQVIGANHLKGRGGSRSRKASTLSARMAESSDPKIRKAWKAFLAGQHSSVTHAAIACGMIKDSHEPLKRLKQYWVKATSDERADFLKFTQEQNTPKLRLAK